MAPSSVIVQRATWVTQDHGNHQRLSSTQSSLQSIYPISLFGTSSSGYSEYAVLSSTRADRRARMSGNDSPGMPIRVAGLLHLCGNMETLQPGPPSTPVRTGLCQSTIMLCQIPSLTVSTELEREKQSRGGYAGRPSVSPTLESVGFTSYIESCDIFFTIFESAAIFLMHSDGLGALWGTSFFIGRGMFALLWHRIFGCLLACF